MTLTLAGIAAFILSVGMAVDANILIFERTKEELRSGKNLSASVEAGFNRAWTSIFDSNVSTLITAPILYYFGTSVVKGFALVLGIGVLISMFTAIVLSRMMLRWIVQQRWARQAHLFGIDDSEVSVDARSRRRGGGLMFDIIGKRRYGYLLSAILVITGLLFILATLIPNGNVGLQFSIAYTGGTVWEVGFEEGTPDPVEVRAILEEQGLPGSEVAITSSDEREYVLIRTEALSLQEPELAEGSRRGRGCRCAAGQHRQPPRVDPRPQPSGLGRADRCRASASTEAEPQPRRADPLSRGDPDRASARPAADHAAAGPGGRQRRRSGPPSTCPPKASSASWPPHCRRSSGPSTRCARRTPSARS